MIGNWVKNYDFLDAEIEFLESCMRRLSYTEIFSGPFLIRVYSGLGLSDVILWSSEFPQKNVKD